ILQLALLDELLRSVESLLFVKTKAKSHIGADSGCGFPSATNILFGKVLRRISSTISCVQHVCRIGLSDKGHCKAHAKESYGYQGLPKGSVRPGYLGNRVVSVNLLSNINRSHVLTATLHRELSRSQSKWK